MTVARETPVQLNLLAEMPADAASTGTLATALASVLDAPRAKRLVAAVLFVPPPGGVLDARLAPLIELVQKRGVAALVEGDARLARTLRADGAHLPATAEPLAAYEAAREMLGTRFIVGADAGQSRHDAMELGEAGADYVAFGIAAHGQGAATAALRSELVAWWGEIFEVPCVAFGASSAEEAGELAAAGADFVALPLPTGRDADLARWLEDVAKALSPLAAAT